MIWDTERTLELLDQNRGQKSQYPKPSAAQSSGTIGENLCKLNGILHENFFLWKTKKILAIERNHLGIECSIDLPSEQSQQAIIKDNKIKRSLKGNNQCKITLNCLHGQCAKTNDDEIKITNDDETCALKIPYYHYV